MNWQDRLYSPPDWHALLTVVLAVVVSGAAGGQGFTYTYNDAGDLMRVGQDNGLFIAYTLDKVENVSAVTTNVSSEGEGEGEGEGVTEGEGSAEGAGEGEGTPPTLDEIAAVLADGFAAADANQDGALSFAEAQAVLPALTQTQFDQLDEDNDGGLTEAELSPETPGGCGCPGNKGTGGVGRSAGDVLLWLLGLAAMVFLRFRGMSV